MNEDPWELMLQEVAKRGNIGASRDDLFKALRGIAYGDLEYLIEELENRGYITIQWLGSYDFVATITDEGLDLLNT
jgi:hypothetical protein